MNEVFDQADAFLLGRRTYEAMAGFWPSVVDDPGMALVDTDRAGRLVARRRPIGCGQGWIRVGR